MEMAADCAAYFSNDHLLPSWKKPRSDDQTCVMFTDPHHVNQRGSRVGQIKASRSLGTIWAQPKRVADLARGALEEQGWMI
jgi:hypothetical protein